MLWIAALAVVLRADAAAITPDHAKALSPAALGDRLLAPGHPTVVEAEVEPGPMSRPPTPPGMPHVTSIDLYFPARPSRDAGFCEKDGVSVRLAPVRVEPGSTPPASRPDGLSTRTLYRWAGTQAARGGCEASRRSFFAIEPAERDRAFAAIRLLARAQAQARGGGALPFAVTFDDQLAEVERRFDSEHPRLPKAPPPPRDARAALAMLPLDRISWIGDPHRTSDLPLAQRDFIDAQGRPLEAVASYLGDVWTVAIAYRGERIVRIGLRRRIPPPF